MTHPFRISDYSKLKFVFVLFSIMTIDYDCFYLVQKLLASVKQSLSQIIV